MKYKFILFDVDDTLLDFERHALHNAFVQLACLHIMIILQAKIN